jgi:hypothetical protein
MTKKTIDYSKTVIYYCYYENTLLYIGHSTDFTRRKQSHKDNCFNEKIKKFNYPFYKYIRENDIDFSDLRWEKENYSCNLKNEAEREEGLRIRLNNPLCNIIVPGRTKKEYYEENKDEINEKKKIDRKENPEKYKNINKSYYEKNKEDILQKQKEDRENNPEKYREKKIKQYYKDVEKSREEKREYHRKNKEAISERKKEDKKMNPDKYKKYSETNYEKHKEQILERMKEKITCDICHTDVRNSDFRRHERTQTHQYNLNKKPSAN